MSTNPPHSFNIGLCLSFPCDSLTKVCKHFLIFAVRVTFPTVVILLVVIIQRVFEEKYKLWSSPLCNFNNIYELQLGCHPVAVVILHVNKTWYWLLLNLSREGYMRSMWWQLGILGTNSAFAFRYWETKKNLCRGGRSQDLPDTDF